MPTRRPIMRLTRDHGLARPGRKAHSSGHKSLGSAAAGSLCAAHCAGVESWRLCHAPGRWLACWLCAVKAGLFALPRPPVPGVR